MVESESNAGAGEEPPTVAFFRRSSSQILVLDKLVGGDREPAQTSIT